MGGETAQPPVAQQPLGKQFVFVAPGSLPQRLCQFRRTRCGDACGDFVDDSQGPGKRMQARQLRHEHIPLREQRGFIECRVAERARQEIAQIVDYPAALALQRVMQAFQHTGDLSQLILAQMVGQRVFHFRKRRRIQSGKSRARPRRKQVHRCVAKLGLLPRGQFDLGVHGDLGIRGQAPFRVDRENGLESELRRQRIPARGECASFFLLREIVEDTLPVGRLSRWYAADQHQVEQFPGIRFAEQERQPEGPAALGQVGDGLQKSGIGFRPLGQDNRPCQRLHALRGGLLDFEGKRIQHFEPLRRFATLHALDDFLRPRQA